MTDPPPTPDPAATPSTSDTASARDAAHIRPADFERRDLPKGVTGRLARFQVVIRQSVLNQIHRHGLSAPEIEICGVLVGSIHHDDAGAWAHIEFAIEGNHAQGRSTQVTFTADTWTHIQSVMDRDHPNRKILGWYHTHPGFGIFLSDMDVFIQTNFFPEPWQMAFVYDPKAAEEGVFIWKDNQPQADPFLVEPDAAVEELTTIVKTAKDVSGKAMPSRELSVLTDRLDAIEKRQRLILFSLILFLLIALGWPLAMNLWLPDLLKRQAPATAPASLPDDQDPTKRPSLLK